MTFTLSPSEDHATRCRFTVVIGPNAKGKSLLLRAVADEAMQVMEQVLSTDESTQLMEQDLSIDNAELPSGVAPSAGVASGAASGDGTASGGPELRPELLGVFPELRPELLRVFPELRPELPAVLAISNLISDGFTFRTYGESQYRYLGVRKARNYTTTGVIRSLTKHSIAIAFVDEWRRNAILKTADLLGLPEPSVRFTALAPPGSSEDRGPRFDVFSKGLDGVKLAKSGIRSAYGELLGPHRWQQALISYRAAHSVCPGGTINQVRSS